jgi:DNA-binding response OmpR family regulator
MVTEKLRVLIADDDERFLRAVSERLAGEGYVVITCDDGYTAVETCRQHRPDLMLIDVRLPMASGFSVLENVRDWADGPRVPVLFMTGSSDQFVDLEAERLGAAGVLRKPFHNGALLDTVGRVLRGRDAPGAAGEGASDGLPGAPSER